MASVSNVEALLHYVRHCFVTGDDTGLCDAVLCSQQALVTDPETGERYIPVVDTEKEDFGRISPEIPYCDEQDSNVIVGQESSALNTSQTNTAELAIHPLSRVTKWPLPHNIVTNEEADVYFPSTPSLEQDATNSSPPLKSRLTRDIERILACQGRLGASNLYADYAQYDGRSCDGDLEKSNNNSSSHPSFYTVILSKLDGFPTNALIKCQPRPKTSVRQLIGLALWQYFNNTTTTSLDADQSKLADNLERFNDPYLDRIQLFIVDKYNLTGDELLVDIEYDFAALNPCDPISKYQFDTLAMAECHSGASKEVCEELVAIPPGNATPLVNSIEHRVDNQLTLLFVTLYISGDMFVLRFPGETTLQTVLDQALQHRGLKQQPGYYCLERASPNGEDVDTSTITRLDLQQSLADLVESRHELRFVVSGRNNQLDPVLLEDSSDQDSESAMPCNSQSQQMQSTMNNSSVSATSKPISRCYRVTMLTETNPGSQRVEVNLTVSDQGLKIDPTINSPMLRRVNRLFAAKSSATTSQSSPSTPTIYPINSLGHCELASSSGDRRRRSALKFRLPGKARVNVFHLYSDTSVSNQHQPLSTDSKIHGTVSWIKDKSDAGDNMMNCYSNNNTTIHDCTMHQLAHDVFKVKQLCFETQWSRAHDLCTRLNQFIQFNGGRAHQLYNQCLLARACRCTSCPNKNNRHVSNRSDDALVINDSLIRTHLQ